MLPVRATSFVLTSVNSYWLYWYLKSQKWSLYCPKVHANWVRVIHQHLCIKPKTFDPAKKICLLKPMVCVMRVHVNEVFLDLFVSVIQSDFHTSYQVLNSCCCCCCYCCFLFFLGTEVAVFSDEIYFMFIYVYLCLCVLLCFYMSFSMYVCVHVCMCLCVCCCVCL